MPTQEPVIFGFSVTALLTVVLNVLAAFKVWSPGPDQLAAVNTAVSVAAALIASLIVRAKVTPVVSMLDDNGRSDPG